MTGGEESAISAPAPAPSPRIAFLQSITVEGFRGIGPKATLDLTPGPGLTLVVGRNGSGKSSFAEALELLLTGDTYRWRDRSKIWRDGWRNLHHPRRHRRRARRSRASGASAPSRASGTDRASSTTPHVVADPRQAANRSRRARLEPCATSSFLSYNELGSLLDDGPSKLYDALAAILGLEDLVHAQTVLEKERKRRDAALKETGKHRKEIAESWPGWTIAGGAGGGGARGGWLGPGRDRRGAGRIAATGEKDGATRMGSQRSCHT